MKKHWYALEGANEKHVAGWEQDMGDDINICKIDEEDSVILLKLTVIERIRTALYMKSISRNFKLKRV